jgi:ATP adenylyltransferase
MAAVENLWAPWRLEYVAGDKPAGCVLCAKRDEDDEHALVVARGEHCYAVLNLYPYNNGHLMVVPHRHVADLEQLTRDESAECQLFLERGIRAARAALGPGGFNVGLNLGEAAGAGIAAHLHWHLVPRWQGDTNFMPVLADVRVMPQHLTTTWQLIRDAWATELERGDETDDV